MENAIYAQVDEINGGGTHTHWTMEKGVGGGHGIFFWKTRVG